MISETILILANKNGNAYSFAKDIFQKLNEKKDKDRTYEFGDVTIMKFKDEEMFLKIEKNLRKKTCFFIQDSSMNPQDWIMSLAIFNDAAMRSSIGKINHVLPYMKYARQDRLTEPRTPITSSVVARILNDKTHRILTTDIHNPASTGAYNIPFDNLKAYPIIINHLKENYKEFLENAVLVAPDIGSAKKIEGYVKRLGLNVAIADKKRKEAGTIESWTIIGDVKDKNVIIVDDMIDSGGTLLKAVEGIKEKGVKRIIVCATHGVFSDNAKEKLNASIIEKIIITDSIPQKSEGKIEVVSLTNLFAEVIYRISNGESISELYN